MAEMPKTIDIGLHGTASSKAVAWAVEPCAQWHRENPGKPRFIIWTSERFAWESANDTGGRVIPLEPRNG
jgi:hypothetical protein